MIFNQFLPYTVGVEVLYIFEQDLIKMWNYFNHIHQN